MSDQVLKDRKVDRPLDKREWELLVWLIENGDDEAKTLTHELDQISVAFECGCGCASIDFAINKKPVDHSNGISVVSEYQYKSEKGNLMGCFLFTAENHLAGIDLWSIDGQETPEILPTPDKLFPLES